MGMGVFVFIKFAEIELPNTVLVSPTSGEISFLVEECETQLDQLGAIHIVLEKAVGFF